MKCERNIEHAEDNFLQRFHRRKLAARSGEPLPEVPMTAASPGPENMPESAGETPVLTDTDMPPVETLSADSDFSGFLSEGVSEALQRAALRKLWRVADFEFVDDLDIYAGDYTAFEPLGNVVTAEMKHRLKLEAQRQAEKLADDALDDEASEALAQAPESDEVETTDPVEQANSASQQP